MSRLADLLLTAWIIFVGVVYYGGTFNDRIGSRTWALGVVYVAMLIISAVAAYIRYSNGSRPADGKMRQ